MLLLSGFFDLLKITAKNPWDSCIRIKWTLIHLAIISSKMEMDTAIEYRCVSIRHLDCTNVFDLGIISIQVEITVCLETQTCLCLFLQIQASPNTTAIFFFFLMFVVSV